MNPGCYDRYKLIFNVPQSACKVCEQKMNIKLGQVVEEFRSSASIHGISRFGTTRKRRRVWMCLVVLFACVLITLIVEQVLRYNQHMILTRVKAEFLDKARFPAVTVCNLNQFKRSIKDCIPGVDLSPLFFSLSELSNLFEHLRRTNISLQNSRVTPTGEQLLECAKRHSHKQTDIIKYCTWDHSHHNCSRLFKPVLTEYGLCFTFNSDENYPKYSTNIGPYSGMRIIADIHQDESYFAKTIQSGMKVILHDPWEDPLPGWRGFLVPPGGSANVIIETDRNNYLPAPHGNCIKTDAEGFVNPLKRYSSYTKMACDRECLTDYIMRKCGCLFMLDNRLDSERLCDANELINCYSKVVDNMTDNARKGCNCAVPCRQTRYLPRISFSQFSSEFVDEYLWKENLTFTINDIRRNIVDVRIYYNDLMLVTVEEVPEVTIPSIIASLGAYMGLFLGASVLSVIELVEFLFLLIVSFRNQSSLLKSKSVDLKTTCMENATS